MSHSHHDHGHGHSHDEPSGSEVNSELYFFAGKIGLFGLIFSVYFMWIALSHSAFGDVLHGVGDNTTVFILGGMAYLCRKGRLTKDQMNFWSAVINTVLLFAAAVGVSVHLLQDTQHEPNVLNMAITGSIMLVSNVVQYFVFHKAHAHEHKHDTHLSAFSTTVQHFFYDIFFDLVVLVSCAVTLVSGLKASRLDEYAAMLLIAALVYSGLKNCWKLWKGQELELV